MSTFRLLAVSALVLFLACCNQQPTGSDKPETEITQKNIERVLGREISGPEAIETIDQIFSAEIRPVGYCCGTASCECTDLGDCINLWFAATCADIPGPDIVGGQCVNEGSCTNNDCSCPD